MLNESTLKKIVAIALATVFISFAFADTALAKPKHHGGPPPRHEMHGKPPGHHRPMPPPRHHFRRFPEIHHIHCRHAERKMNPFRLHNLRLRHHHCVWCCPW